MKRRSKYRKHVEHSVLDTFPEPAENEEVVVVVASRGGNILEVRPVNETEETSNTSLCLLPSKFKRLVWVRRGTILIVSGASEDYITSAGSKGKVRYTVNHILFSEQVKHLQKLGIIKKQSSAVGKNKRCTCVERTMSEKPIAAEQQQHNAKLSLDGAEVTGEDVNTDVDKIEGADCTEPSTANESEEHGSEKQSRTVCSLCGGVPPETLSHLTDGIDKLALNKQTQTGGDEESCTSEVDDYSDLVENTNRRGGAVSSSESETDSDEN